VTSDFSYRASRCAGEGWVLVGDAFGFLDPMYSSGVYFALKSGELAADAINEAFEAGDFSAQRLSRWGDSLSYGMTMVRKLVYAFYTKEFSFGRFVKTYPQYKNTIIDLLVGDVFRPEVAEVFEPMKAMAPIPDAIPLEKPGAADDKGTRRQGDKVTNEDAVDAAGARA
jgi:flavin-dependent dehydrogenase